MSERFEREADGWQGVCLADDTRWEVSTPDGYEEKERAAIQEEEKGSG